MKGTARSSWLWIVASACLAFTTSGQVDPCGLTWQRVNSPNSPGLWIQRAWAYDSQREVAVLFGGGKPGAPYMSETWEWNGVSWSQPSSSTPPARRDAAMAYDSHRGVCVLFGGGTNIFEHHIPFNDTWEWNGSVWTLRQGNNPSATDRPPPLDFPKMTYDGTRRRVVLIGSTERVDDSINPVTRTWEWDGTNWSVRATAPPTRYQPAMAYDPMRRVTVVFGGKAYGGGLLNDTWTWDGTTWASVAAGGPPGRYEHAMAFDNRRRVMVMFGGSNDGGAELSDTWEWDGQSWSVRSFASRFGLTGRRLHQMWYEPSEERVIVFGGTWSRRNDDGSFDHFILDDLWEARPPGIWIDFNYSGVEGGGFNSPYNTLLEGVSAASTGCILHLKAGSSAETLTISKQLILQAENGLVTIGQ
jgi:hypothetical protein